ncbi:D-alanyl-D-alanine carboxypeptidase fraction C [Citrobacter freundii]|nr:D-alanyl-D-alanine carboxypeptidase fraction C [Citrobacter freundii]
MHGLDAAGQFSTARDMALLGKALIHDVPEEYAIHKEKEFTFNKIRQPNRNRLLWSTNLNVDGMKTGYHGRGGIQSGRFRDPGRYAPDLRGVGGENRPHSF